MILDIDFDKAASDRKNVAIEFTENSLRILQLEQSSGKLKVKSFAEVEINPEFIKDGIIQKPVAVGSKLVEALAKVKPNKIDTPYAICLIPQEYTFITTIQLPAIQKEELRELVLRKVEDVIPMNLEDVYWDWHRLGTQKRKTSLQIAAVPKQLINSYMDTLKTARLTPLLFEPTSAAAFRTQEKGQKENKNATKSPTVLLEVNSRHGVLSVVHKNGIVFSTELPMEETQPMDMVGAFDKKLQEISQYIQTQLKIENNESLNIAVYGGHQETDELITKLSQNPSYKISKVTYQNQLSEITEVIPSNKLGNYVPLIGAGIRGLSKYTEGSSINLIPQIAKEMFQRKELIHIIRNYLTFIAVDVALIVLMLLLVSFQITGRLNELQNRYESIINISESKRIKEIEVSIAELNQSSAELLALIGENYDWTQVLDVLNNTTPKEITLVNVSAIPAVDNNTSITSKWTISISGLSNNRESIIKFMESLRADSILQNVKLPVESLEDEENISFVIEAELPFESIKYGKIIAKT